MRKQDNMNEQGEKNQYNKTYLLEFQILQLIYIDLGCFFVEEKGKIENGEVQKSDKIVKWTNWKFCN